MTELISGMLVAGYLVAGLHFLKFWRTTGDRLFASFACAFWVLALQRGALALFAGEAVSVTPLYGLRLLAFLLILLGIADKNRNRKPSRVVPTNGTE